MNEIRHRVGIKATLQSVYEAVYRPSQLTGWWAASASGSGELGTQIELSFPGYPDHVWEIVELSAGERVRMKFVLGPEPWRGSELPFDFDDAGSQVFVTLTHTTAPTTPKDAVQYFWTKWPMFLVSLKLFLETGNGMPYPNDLKIQHD